MGQANADARVEKARDRRPLCGELGGAGNPVFGSNTSRARWEQGRGAKEEREEVGGEVSGGEEFGGEEFGEGI